MKFTVRSPIGTDIDIDLESNVVSIPKVGISSEPILGWGNTNHDGENVTYVKLSGDRNVLIGADYLKVVADKKRKYAQEKLESVVHGITLLRAAHRGEAAYSEALNAMMEDEMNDGVNPPQPPKLSTDELSKMYPRAALYIKADAYSNASHHAKSAAGNKAKKLLEEGGSENEASAILENWLPASAYWD